MEGESSVRVLVPTRDRPDNAKRIIESFYDTKALPKTSIWLVLDIDSPHRAKYDRLLAEIDMPVGAYFTVGNMVQRTNIAARAIMYDTPIIGWAADDNVFVTKGWDDAIEAEFFDSPYTGLIDTNDLLVTAEDLKTGACFIRSACVKALGYFYLPDCEHLYVDRAAALLYREASAYKRREDIIIEHAHPYAFKSQWDEAYSRVNTQGQDSRDGRAFSEWHDGDRFSADVQKVIDCLRLGYSPWVPSTSRTLATPTSSGSQQSTAA